MLLSLVGRRVRLVHLHGGLSWMQPGEEGVVRWAESSGTVQVDWDNGAQVLLVEGEDDWEYLD